jgi:hypothetical protein
VSHPQETNIAYGDKRSVIIQPLCDNLAGVRAEGNVVMGATQHFPFSNPSISATTVAAAAYWWKQNMQDGSSVAPVPARLEEDTPNAHVQGAPEIAMAAHLRGSSPETSMSYFPSNRQNNHKLPLSASPSMSSEVSDLSYVAFLCMFTEHGMA